MPPEGVTVTTFDPSTGERMAFVGQELGLTSLGCRLLTFAPRQRGRIHRHRAQEEVYVVLEGELTVLFEGGEELTVGPMQAARVPPPVRRQLANRGSARFVVLALGAAGEHVTGDGEAFTDWDASEGRPPQEVPAPEDLPA